MAVEVSDYRAVIRPGRDGLERSSDSGAGTMKNAAGQGGGRGTASLSIGAGTVPLISPYSSIGVGGEVIQYGGQLLTARAKYDRLATFLKG